MQTEQDFYYMPEDQFASAGGFTEKDFGRIFFFKTDVAAETYAKYFPLEWREQFPDIVEIGPNGGFRACKILKTRARVVSDEDDSGNPVADTWEIKRHS